MVRAELLRHYKTGHWRSIPDDIQSRLASCVAASTVLGLEDEEIRQLNISALGGPDPEKDVQTRALGRPQDVLYRIDNHDSSVLEAACPEDLPDFKKHGF
jgi:hypothetical protein